MGDYGGFADVARKLGTSRQQVYVWWRRRDRNSFPDRHEVKAGPKSGKKLFKISDVLAWHDIYVPNKGGRPPLD